MNEMLLAWKAVTAGWALPGAFAGVIWGIIGGALPGISPSIAMALLLPFTYGMDPTPALVMLASTYVGAEYGGSIPAILIRTPGTSSAPFSPPRGSITIAESPPMHLPVDHAPRSAHRNGGRLSQGVTNPIRRASSAIPRSPAPVVCQMV